MSNFDIQNTKVTNNKSIASLILGILSIVFFIQPLMGMTSGIIGLILGIFGVNEAKRFNQNGKKIAIAGVICSSIGLHTTNPFRYYCFYCLSIYKLN